MRPPVPESCNPRIELPDRKMFVSDDESSARSEYRKIDKVFNGLMMKCSDR